MLTKTTYRHRTPAQCHICGEEIEHGCDIIVSEPDGLYTHISCAIHSGVDVHSVPRKLADYYETFPYGGINPLHDDETRPIRPDHGSTSEPF